MAAATLRFPPGKRADGVLHLVVKGAHAPMMQHITPEIAERVNRFFGYVAVARVQIRQGEVTAREPRRAPVSLRPMPVEMGQGLVGIADPELRAVLDSPDLRQRLTGVGLEVLTSTPAEMLTRQSNLITYMTASMKAAGVEPE